MQFGAGDPRTYTGLSPTMLIFVNMTSGATLAAPAISESLAGSGIYQFQWGTTTPIAFLADAATTSPGSAGRYVAGQLDPADRADEYGTTMIAIGTTLFGQGVTNLALGTTSVAIGTTLFGQGATNVALGTSAVALGTSSIAQGLTALGYGVTTYGYGVSIYAEVQAIGVTLSGIGITVSGFGGSLGTLMALVGSTTSSFGDVSTQPVTLFGFLRRVTENLEGDSQYVKVSGIWTIMDSAASVTLAVKTITNSATMVVKS